MKIEIRYFLWVINNERRTRNVSRSKLWDSVSLQIAKCISAFVMYSPENILEGRAASETWIHVDQHGKNSFQFKGQLGLVLRT